MTNKIQSRALGQQNLIDDNPLVLILQDKIKGIYATDWQRKELLDEFCSLTTGLAIMGGLVATAFYILRRPA